MSFSYGLRLDKSNSWIINERYIKLSKNYKGMQDNQAQQLPYLKMIKEGKFEQAEIVGDTFFELGSFKQAIEVYQKIIQGGYTVPFQIQGVGSSQHSISRYEWFIYKWYSDERKSGKIKGNVYDALSLCYNQVRHESQLVEKGILWYEDILGAREGYELYMGYANLLSNKSRYDEAIKFFKRVILMRPKLINAYVNLAMIHEYRRIQKSKSISTAKQILQMDPNNMYASFILARNQSNVDTKILKLKEIYEKFPDYVRIANDIGIANGTKKQHRQAIKWYKKCLEIAPDYASAYNNVGVRTQLLKQYNQALVWYFKACELDHEYKAAHSNASDIFDQLKFDDDMIIQQMNKYPKLDHFMFYYYLGLAYYDKKKVDVSIKWYKKAEQLNSNNFQLMNSVGIAYDQIKELDRAEEYYLVCIALNPQYHMAYYNLGILQKTRNNVDKAIQWYKKATQVNPRYNKPYNNLGNIYKNRNQFDQAIACYQKAVELHSTYTLAWTNLAICLLNQERYQEAFNAFARAKQLLPNDNNGLSDPNKNFLKESLEKFDKEGEKWRKTCSISHDEKQNLRYLIHSYESNFKQAPSSIQGVAMSNQIALRPEMLNTVNLIYQDQFLLKGADKILDSVKQLSLKDIQYFHIIPQINVQYFLKGISELNRPPLEIQQELSCIIKKFSHDQRASIYQKIVKFENIDIKLHSFGFPSEASVNLFKESTYFDSYEALYAQIEKVNTQAQSSLKEFAEIVEAVRIRSNGFGCGTVMTLPKRANQQFSIMTSIIQQILSKQISQTWKKSIIGKISASVRKEGEKATLVNVIHQIIDIWSDEITIILKERFKSQVETVCNLADLLKSKLMFNSLDDLVKCVEALEKLSHVRQYKILQLSNKLSEQSNEVVIKIMVNEAICKLQLVMRQDENLTQFLNSIEQIERSPLGSIFGSYLYMSRGFKYPLLTNCKDIESRLKETDKKTAEAARYIINVLQAKP